MCAVRLTLGGRLVDNDGWLTPMGRRAVYAKAFTVPEDGRFTLDVGRCMPDWEALQLIRRTVPWTAEFVLEAGPEWWAMWERVLANPEPRKRGA